MKTNDLKRGSLVKLRNGWEAEIADNMKGNTRLATVYGDYTETGSVYSHDITHFKICETWFPVEHTPQQIKLMEQLKRIGFR
jgi:hypothetical protein